MNSTFVTTNRSIASKGLPGVGFTRAEWNAIKDMNSGTVNQTVLDATLLTGPVERGQYYQRVRAKLDGFVPNLYILKPMFNVPSFSIG